MNLKKSTLKDKPVVRWFVLILIASLTFATYWFQDFFSGLKPLMESELGITSAEFGSIIQWTTWANVFGMIIIGGIVLDKFGIRVAGPIFGGIATIGAFLTAMGGGGYLSSDPTVNLYLMMAGRLCFGIGLEVVCVIVSKTIVKWFSGYELAFAFGINMGLGRLGSALSTAFSIDIADGMVSPAANFAATLVGLSFLFLLIYLIFDWKLDKSQAGEEKEEDESEQFRIADLLSIIKDRSFIYIALLCVTFYAAVFPFMQYAPDLLINKFGFSYTLDLDGLTFGESVRAMLTNGPKVAALIPLTAIVFTIIFGKIVDKKGRAATLMMVGSGLLIFAHLSLSIFNSVALGYMGLMALGIAFSMVPAAMWPSVAKIIKENKLGTAYATMFTIQNWGLNALFFGIGWVLDISNKDNLPAIKAKEAVYDYTNPILMLVALGLIAMFFAFQLKKADRKQGYGLEIPKKE